MSLLVKLLVVQKNALLHDAKNETKHPPCFLLHSNAPLIKEQCVMQQAEVDPFPSLSHRMLSTMQNSFLPFPLRLCSCWMGQCFWMKFLGKEGLHCIKIPSVRFCSCRGFVRKCCVCVLGNELTLTGESFQWLLGTARNF